ncbi:(deoxy)nucleoside triphosphate pyrophosphohydrolase [Actinomyces sp. zg-332]|uniref:(deoxy)nucleoside triphosphate pyrophosphohydrolase n=1 Tax=Actinomyces sp. zg-332 TaxID=2708340 RepID=UPI0014204BB2|nr:(deoxy)nucleoside triphosphate pyrophosphohydrolase [Actinomyces sp. zg-332]QPK93771.1 (deoxy)nucleoside triphosphate pyrophosphohydrolase [Actinomyces sp. zg-332]
MKIVTVVAGVFIDGNKIFSSQRSRGTHKGSWEFPGGKVEDNESHEQTLKREIMEELGAEIKVIASYDTVEYEYEDFYLKMYLYLAEFITEPKLIEHLDFKWLSVDEIDDIKWLPADIAILPKIKESLS